MSLEKVERLLDDLRMTHPDVHALAQAARSAIRAAAPNADEKLMYGGIMFYAPAPFCGLFAYGAHVSIEFGKGAQMQDTYRALEGSGKFRRHIKLHAATDIESKHLRKYIAQALHLSAAAS